MIFDRLTLNLYIVCLHLVLYVNISKKCVWNIVCKIVISHIKQVYFDESKLLLTIPEVIKTQELHLHKTQRHNIISM